MNPWSIFWQQGHSTTFGDYFKQGYTGAVADWWQSILSGLPANPVVMEVGCGNCSLLPAMVKSGVKGRYIGVDLATVRLSPVSEQGLSESGIEVTLHSETPAEKVPEPDASIALIASVFGIEYSNLDQSLPEVLRLLKPEGQFCALLHHDDSVVTSMSRRAISEFNNDDLDGVIDALNTISSERDKTPSMAELGSNPRAEEGRTLINRMADKYLIDTDLKTANATMFEFMNDALKFFKMMGAPSQDRRHFISSLEKEHKASHERFQQMVSVAFNDNSIENLQAKLDELGFTKIEASVIYSKDDVLAWELRSEKVPGDMHVEN
jgi:ubiquinone/menaquinone biosynthesis C-methylase UbiE